MLKVNSSSSLEVRVQKVIVCTCMECFSDRSRLLWLVKVVTQYEITILCTVKLEVEYGITVQRYYLLWHTAEHLVSCLLVYSDQSSLFNFKFTKDKAYYYYQYQYTLLLLLTQTRLHASKCQSICYVYLYVHVYALYTTIPIHINKCIRLLYIIAYY